MRAKAVVLLLSAALTLAGCSSGSPQPIGATATGPAPSATTPNSTPSPTAPAEPQTPTDLISYIQAGSPISIASYTSNTQASFSTPSGNISCGLWTAGGATVLCFIKEDTWPPITAQACNDFGDFTDRSVAAFADGVRRGDCFSEAPFTFPGKVMPYGSTISNGSVACRSESWFLACAHLPTGNGFVISRAIYHPYGTLLPPRGN
jgi:hypothetical protein